VEPAHAIAFAEEMAAELGEVVAGIRPGRSRAAEKTVFASVGLPFQDLAVAWEVYRAARAAGRGTTFRFL